MREGGVIRRGVVILLALATNCLAQDPKFQVLPMPGHQASFLVEAEERVTWHFGEEYPRPFFFPFRSPGGDALTRMGHPGAPNHDHHRSIWFAHNDVEGCDFWSDNTKARIRQKQWLVYEDGPDGPDEAVMAVLLGWDDGEGNELMEQELVAALRCEAGLTGIQLELQSTFRPKAESVTLGKTNFGFLGVRMASELSVHFGQGTIMDSEGRTGEKEVFGQRARWVAYTRARGGEGSLRRGVVYFDHPSNPRYPTYWHVREDGWMGASFGMKEGYRIEREKPLRLRYLLLGCEDSSRKDWDRLAVEFSQRPEFEVAKSARPHRQFEVRREAAVKKDQLPNPP